MKATGIIRRVDDLGRIVIPKEIRRTLKIKDGDPLELYIDGTSIVWKKYSFLDVNEVSGVAGEALRKVGIKYAIYDNATILSTNGRNEFEPMVQDCWADARNVMICGVSTIFPVIYEGELVGHVVVNYLKKNDESAVNAVISMMLSML